MKYKIPSIFLTLFPLSIGILCMMFLSNWQFHTIDDLKALFKIDPFQWKDIITSIIIGCMVGWERKIRNKPIGMRTSVMVILSTYAFVAMSYHVSTTVISQAGQTMTDPSRVIGQVITGVGFLGAGLMFTRKDTVNGVTSAAMIWFLAAMGVCVASGYALMSIKITMITIMVLIVLDSVDDIVIYGTKSLFHHKSRTGKLLQKQNKKKPRRRRNRNKQNKGVQDHD